MSNELGVVAGMAQFDTVDADCIAVGRVTRMTSDNSIAQHVSINIQLSFTAQLQDLI